MFYSFQAETYSNVRHRVKGQGGGISRSGFLNRNIPSPNVPDYNTRTIAEQQAALNLALLSTKATDVRDGTVTLIEALLVSNNEMNLVSSSVSHDAIRVPG